MNMHTCRTCGQNWAVVTGTMLAHPGRRTPAQTVTVPNEDVFGKVHGTRQAQTSHWVQEGPSQALVVTQTTVDDRYTWPCTCGHPQDFLKPRLYVVPCQHEAGPDGLCLVAHNRVHPPADRYTNPRHGAACPCCRHQGHHLVQWGQKSRCGASPEGA